MPLVTGPSSFIEIGIFLGQLNDYQLLTKHSVPYILCSDNASLNKPRNEKKILYYTMVLPDFVFSQ